MEAQETPQIEQEAQTPKKRELALVSRSTYLKEKALQWIFFACAFLAVVTVILIFVFTTYSALPVFTDIGLADFFSFTWAPSEGHYGIMSLLAGSGLVTVGALAMGVPLGVGTAVYLSRSPASACAGSSAPPSTCWRASPPSSTASLAWSSSARLSRS